MTSIEVSNHCCVITAGVSMWVVVIASVWLLLVMVAMTLSVAELTLWLSNYHILDVVVN